MNGQTPMRVAMIGTRRAFPKEIDYVELLAYAFASKGATILTGCADGVDYASMKGGSKHSPTSVEIFLPWANYNKEYQHPDMKKTIYDEKKHVKWKESVARNHPNPSALTRGAFSLHARNYGIIETADIVIALPSADRKGGTEQGIRLAKELGKPIYNLREKEDRQAIKMIINMLPLVEFE